MLLLLVVYDICIYPLEDLGGISIYSDGKYFLTILDNWFTRYYIDLYVKMKVL